MKYLKNIHAKWYYTLGDLISKGSFFVLILILSYFLTPDEYAQISLFNSMVTLFFVIITLNTTNSFITRKKFDLETDFRKVISTVVTFLIILSVIYLVLSFFVNQIFDSFYNIPSKLIVYSIIVSVFYGYFDLLITNILIEKDKNRYLIVSIVYSVFLFVFTIVMLLFFPKIGIYAIVFTRLIILIGFSFYSLFFLKKKLSLKFNINPKILKSALIYSIPLSLHSISGFVLNYLDKFMINGMVNSFDTALYSFSYNLATVVFVFALAINKAFVPDFFSMLNDDDVEGIEERVKKDLRNLIYLSLLFISALGLIYPLFPDVYNQTFLVTVLLIFNYMIFYGYTIYSNYLYYSSKTGIIFRNTLISGVLSVVLNLFLITKFSYVGATISTIISFVIMLLLFYLSSRKHFEQVVNIKHFIKGYLPAIIFIVIYLFFSHIYTFKLVIFIVLVYNLVSYFIENKKGGVGDE